MPTYSFRNKVTGEEFNQFMSISEKEKHLLENPHIEQFISQAPALHSGIGLGVRKVDDGFKDLLSNMKKKNPGNSINS